MSDQKTQDQWFDTARVVDPDWVELEVTTAIGKKVQYRFPRRAYFTVINRPEGHHPANEKQAAHR